jgi:hypothetical protein
MVGVAGCVTTGGTRYIDTSCAAFAALTYSSTHDSAETIAEIKANNRVYEKLCPSP